MNYTNQKSEFSPGIVLHPNGLQDMHSMDSPPPYFSAAVPQYHPGMYPQLPEYVAAYPRYEPAPSQMAGPPVFGPAHIPQPAFGFPSQPPPTFWHVAGAPTYNANAKQMGSPPVPPSVPYGHPSGGMTFPGAPRTEPTISFPGYEGLTDEGDFFPPPPIMPEAPAPMPFTGDTKWTTLYVTEDIAKRIFMEYATKRCCYSTAPAKHMDITELKPFNTYRYRLDSFAETRQCKWVAEPYSGQAVDSPSNGPAPNLWDIPANPPMLFQKNKQKMPIPHTSTVQTCLTCHGNGKNRCLSCQGTSKVTCIGCSGGKRASNGESCYMCRGNGSTMCSACAGIGTTICHFCAGKGKVLKYLQLTVKWANTTFENVAEHNSEFPTKKFKKVQGQEIYRDEKPMLAAVSHFPVSSINEASINGLQQHRSQFASKGLILRQKHVIEWLPLARAVYTWKANSYSFFVYGTEHKVYTGNYPKKCCCVLQ